VAARRGRKTGSQLNSFYLVIGLVAVIGVGVLAYVVLGERGRPATEPVDMAAFQDPQELFARARGVTVGSADAPARMIYFSDYLCPACGEFARVKRLLLQEFPEDQLRLEFYDFPLGSGGRFLAARAGRCAEDQGRFWDYHDVLFSRQSEWGRRDNPASSLSSYASELGLDRSAFNACLNSDEHAELVTANRVLGEQLGVNATPWVILHGQRLRNPFDIELLRSMIRGEAAEL
jgi:protein-disulfide isomerase